MGYQWVYFSPRFSLHSLIFQICSIPFEPFKIRVNLIESLPLYTFDFLFLIPSAKKRQPRLSLWISDSSELNSYFIHRIFSTSSCIFFEPYAINFSTISTFSECSYRKFTRFIAYFNIELSVTKGDILPIRYKFLLSLSISYYLRTTYLYLLYYLVSKQTCFTICEKIG